MKNDWYINFIHNDIYEYFFKQDTQQILEIENYLYTNKLIPFKINDIQDIKNTENVVDLTKKRILNALAIAKFDNTQELLALNEATNE